MAGQSNLGVRRTLKQIGVSKSNFYDRSRRCLDDGYDGLKNQSKQSHQSWNRIPDQEQAKIPEYALENTWPLAER